MRPIGIETAGVATAEAHNRAPAWLARVGLAGFGDRYLYMLSVGQRKRVGLAQVLIRDPHPRDIWMTPKTGALKAYGMP